MGINLNYDDIDYQTVIDLNFIDIEFRKKEEKEKYENTWKQLFKMLSKMSRNK